MEQMFLSTALEFKEINTFEPGAWINLVNPSQEESVRLSEQFNIDMTYRPMKRGTTKVTTSPFLWELS